MFLESVFVWLKLSTLSSQTALFVAYGHVRLVTGLAGNRRAKNICVPFLQGVCYMCCFWKLECFNDTGIFSHRLQILGY